MVGLEISSLVFLPSPLHHSSATSELHPARISNTLRPFCSVSHLFSSSLFMSSTGRAQPFELDHLSLSVSLVSAKRTLSRDGAEALPTMLDEGVSLLNVNAQNGTLTTHQAQLQLELLTLSVLPLLRDQATDVSTVTPTVSSVRAV